MQVGSQTEGKWTSQEVNVPVRWEAGGSLDSGGVSGNGEQWTETLKGKFNAAW